MKARVLQITGADRVELRELSVPPPGPGEVLVRSEASAVSAGSERLVLSAQLEPGVALDETLSTLEGQLVYPLAYGYCSVGRVEQIGPGVGHSLLGARVFAFHPHQSHFLAKAQSVIPLPEALSAARGALLANTETAVSLVMDAAPILGEVSTVIGLGIIGQLVLGIASRLGVGEVMGIDVREDRRSLAQRTNPAARVGGAVKRGGSDVVYEVSGASQALASAIEAARREGRIIVGSWYGTGAVPLALGTRAHRNRNTVRFSQVSHIDSALSGRFDHRRRMGVALHWLQQLEVEPLLTHHVPFSEAVEAWELLRAPPPGCLQIILTHD